MVLVEVSRTQGHLLLLENGLHLLITDMLVFNKEVSMLGLSMAIVDFLLQTFIVSATVHNLSTFLVFLEFPRTAASWLIEVVLGHASAATLEHGPRKLLSLKLP